MFVMGRWEAEAAHPRLRGATVCSRPGDGISDASISQPASFTVVQPCEFPGSVELSHSGDLSSALLTSPLSLRQIHLVRGLEIVDVPFGENTFIVVFPELLMGYIRFRLNERFLRGLCASFLRF